MPVNFRKKYSDLFAEEILRLKPAPGTMPADMRVIKQVIAAKFGDKKFVQALVNDIVGAKGVNFIMK